MPLPGVSRTSSVEPVKVYEIAGAAPDAFAFGRVIVTLPSLSYAKVTCRFAGDVIDASRPSSFHSYVVVLPQPPSVTASILSFALRWITVCGIAHAVSEQMSVKTWTSRPPIEAVFGANFRMVDEPRRM